MIEEFLTEGVCATIKSWLPELAKCETHPGRFTLDSLKTVATKLPGLFVGWLAVPEVENEQGGIRRVELTLVAFLVVGDKPGLPRDVAARAMMETLVVRLPEHQFGRPEAEPARKVHGQNLYDGKLGAVGATMWSLSWQQTVRLPAEC